MQPSRRASTLQIPFNGMDLLKEITADYCEMRKQPSHQEGTGFVTRQFETQGRT